MSDFKKFLKRVFQLIDLYKQHEGINDKGWYDIEMDPEREEIDVFFNESDSCGDTNSLGWFQITEEMFENPELGLSKMFQKRAEENHRKELDRVYVEACEDAIKRAQREFDEEEEYKRLRKKYGY